MDDTQAAVAAEPEQQSRPDTPRADAGGTPGPTPRGKPDEKSAAEPAKTKGSRLPLIILAIVVAIGAVLGIVWWFLHRDQLSTDDAYTNGRAIMIAPQVSGTVVELAVNDNQFVHAGDLLIAIDPRPYAVVRDQALGQREIARAQLDNARIALEKARTSLPAQLSQAEGQLAQAQSQLSNAQLDYKRQHAVSRGATTQQSVDQSTAGQAQAQAQVQVAQSQVDIAKLIPQDIAQTEAQVRQLEGQVAQAQATLDQAEVNLSFTRIVAPQDGWVTRRNVERGNYLQPGTQVMAVVPPEVWVPANFKATELNRMRQGQPVDIEVDAYPGLQLRGHVESVQLGSGSKFSAFPAENATGNFVKIVQRVPVKIAIDRGLDPNRPLPLGLSVVPTVYLK